MIRELAAIARWMFSEVVMIAIAIWTLYWFAGAIQFGTTTPCQEIRIEADAQAVSPLPAH